MQDLEQGAADELRVRVRLREQSWDHPGAEHGRPGMVDRAQLFPRRRHVAERRVGVGAAAGEQPQEVRLA